MAERILVPFDGSPLSTRALDRAVTRHPDARITVLYVIDPVLAIYDAEIDGLSAAESWADRMDDVADEICAEATDRAADHDCEIRTATEIGRPARTILAYAEEHGIEHIIMGSHGRTGASRLVLGSVAERIIRHSPVPVTIVR